MTKLLSVLSYGFLIFNRYIEGGTDTGLAINATVTDLFGNGQGARDISENVPRVAIVMTDGKSNYDTVLEQADKARARGITLFAIGIGTEIDETELHQIANKPDDKFVFQVNDFDVIENIRSLVSRRACQGTLGLFNTCIFMHN